MSDGNQKLQKTKIQWMIRSHKVFGNCGKILYSNSTPVGYAEYGPSDRFPRIIDYQSQPIGSKVDGVVFLSCLYIADENFRGRGLGIILLDEICETLRHQGFKAVETYARTDSVENPSGPVELYLKKRFHIKNRNNPKFPIARLEL